jgi:hypothetical protein
VLKVAEYSSDSRPRCGQHRRSYGSAKVHRSPFSAAGADARRKARRGSALSLRGWARPPVTIIGPALSSELRFFLRIASRFNTAALETGRHSSQMPDDEPGTSIAALFCLFTWESACDCAEWSL